MLKEGKVILINLRPQTLSEFKGKDSIKENLKTFIDSCKKQNKQLDHILIYGLPGTGKTTLAHIIANELGSKIKIVQGGNILKNTDIINLVLSLSNGDILFIDEIHAVPSYIVELLYTVMEDYALDISLGKDFNTKITRIEVPKFTLIGATTLYGKISLPLEERFGIVLNLKSYDIYSINEIINQACVQMNIKLNTKDINLISSNSRGIPRNAIKLFKRVCDFKSINKNVTVEEILTKLDIHEDGLNSYDIEYLKILNKSSTPIGLKTASQIVDIDSYTLETKVESYLLNKNYISKTNNGRTITQKGKEYLNNYEN